MLRIVDKSLTLKMIIALAAILIVAFAVLCLSILNKQNGFLGRMSGVVTKNIADTNNQAKQQFGKLEGDVRLELAKMSDQAAANLSAATVKSLKQEETNIRQAMEKMLTANAKAVAALLASIAPDAIMSKQSDDLIEFSRAASKTDEIVFALFFDDKGKLLPGYANVVDDLVIAYLKKGKGEEDTEKMLDAARQDPAGFLPGLEAVGADLTEIAVDLADHLGGLRRKYVLDARLVLLLQALKAGGKRLDLLADRRFVDTDHDLADCQTVIFDLFLMK